MNDENKPVKEAPSAKDISLVSMIVAAVWIGVLTLVKGFWPVFMSGEFALSMKDIALSGLLIAGAFSPVYLNTSLDKFLKR